MNVLEQILMEIKEYTESVYGCNIDKIVEYQGKHGEDPCTYIVQGIAEATDIIRKYMTSALDSDNQGNWIPCSEILPHEQEYVLATVKHSSWISDYDSAWVSEEEKIYHPEKRGVYKGKYEEGIWWFTDEENEWIRCEEEPNEARNLGIVYDTVLAWQPLPEPYKGEYS